MELALVVAGDQLEAASRASGASVALTTFGAGLLGLALIVGIGAAATNGRLKEYPRWRRPFGVTAAAAAIVGMVLLAVGLALR